MRRLKLLGTKFKGNYVGSLGEVSETCEVCDENGVQICIFLSFHFEFCNKCVVWNCIEIGNACVKFGLAFKSTVKICA